MTLSAKFQHTLRNAFAGIEWKGTISTQYATEIAIRLTVAAIVLLAFHMLASQAARRVRSMARNKNRNSLVSASNSAGALLGVGDNGKDEEEAQEDAKEREKENQQRMKDGEYLAGEEQYFRSHTVLASLGGSIVYSTIMAVGFMFVLRIVGVEIATIAAMISSLGIAVGFAVQGTLSDIASGVLLAVFQIFYVGDIIKIDSLEGRVVDFRLINTLIQSLPDMTLVTVPNRMMQDKVVVNYSRSRYHMFKFTILLENTERNNFSKVIDSLRKDLKKEKRYPELLRGNNIPPTVCVLSMDGMGTALEITVPMSAENLMSKRSAVTTRVRLFLEEKGAQLNTVRPPPSLSDMKKDDNND